MSSVVDPKHFSIWRVILDPDWDSNWRVITNSDLDPTLPFVLDPDPTFLT